MNVKLDTIDRVFHTDEMIVAGHRGLMTFFPENTLLGMKMALDAGVDMLEIDLNLTKDKVVVVMHDNAVDRTTDGQGFIRDMTLEEIKALDAGILRGVEFQGLKVPTLEELCQFLRPYPEVLLNVEIKERTHETVDYAMKILEKEGLVPRCVFACFDAEILAYLYDTYQVKCQGFPAEYMDNFVEGEHGTYSKLFAVGIAMKPSPKNPKQRLLSKELVEEFFAMGIQPWAYCPDTTEMVIEAIESGTRLITCNNPIPALAELKARGFHPYNIQKVEL